MIQGFGLPLNFRHPSRAPRYAARQGRENSFEALKGLRWFRQEFGLPKSDTLVEMKLPTVPRTPAGQELTERLKALANRFEAQGRGVRWEYQKLLHEAPPFDLSEFMGKMMGTVQQTGVGRCGESATILSYWLRSRGHDAHAVRMRFFDTWTFAYAPELDHTLTLFGQRPNADLTQPAAWGPQAVMLDGFFGFEMKPDEAIRWVADKLQVDYTLVPQTDLGELVSLAPKSSTRYLLHMAVDDLETVAKIKPHLPERVPPDFLQNLLKKNEQRGADTGVNALKLKLPKMDRMG